MKQFLRLIILNMALLTASLVFAAAKPSVLLIVMPGCEYCSRAENLLENYGIKYRTSISQEGPVPRLYVNGKYKGTGLDAVQTWVKTNKAK